MASAHRRRSLDSWERIAAAAVGAASGLAAWYLARLWLGREPLRRRDE